jgi:RimJ/RimL family protein N-acetyltransferase
MSLTIIEGKHVDLIIPFPPSEYKRVLNWFRCFKTLAETPEFPTNETELAERFSRIKNLRSYAIIDKHGVLGVKHVCPLVGIITFDDDTVVNGNFHIATTRRAWGSRLGDIAGQMVLRHIFETMPHLTRVTVSTLAVNAPAKGLAKRLGFRYEGNLRDAMIIRGTPMSMALFGLTRADWESQHLGDVEIEPVIHERHQHIEPTQTELVDERSTTVNV